jgi:hypothetical protein
LTVTSSNESVAKVTAPPMWVAGAPSIGSFTITIEGAGTTTLRATLNDPASGINITKQTSFTVAKAEQETLMVFANPSAVAPGGSSTVSTVSGMGTGGTSYSTTGDCTIDGSVLTAGDSIGTCTVTATKEGDENYLSGEATVVVTVSTSTPTLGSFNDIDKTFGDAPFTLTPPTSPSSGEFTYTSSNTE